MKQDFIDTARKLENKAQKLINKLNVSFLADRLVKENLIKTIGLLQDIPAGCDLLAQECECKPRNIKPKTSSKLKDSGESWKNASVSSSVKKWRQEPTWANYAKIPLAEKKEIFDYFFRYDVYGPQRKKQTTHLSRGVNDPNYFFPPAFVKVGLNISSQNDWFGYSSSLGHDETRTKIAELETVRRNQKKFSLENTAVIQGCTEGLNSVLSFLSKQSAKRKNCFVLTPTYAPIIDVIKYYFTPKLCVFNKDYSFDVEKIINAIDEKTAVVLFSIPHNPGGFDNLKKFLPALQKKCAQYGAYFIIDEIMFDNQISSAFDPIKYKNLIVLSSYSKMYNIPGLKLGHILADSSFIDKFYRHASTTYGSPPSFLYYTASLIAFYEKASLQAKAVSLPEELKNKISQKTILLEEFKIWKETVDLHAKFQKYAVQTLIKHFKLQELVEVFGLNDASPNMTLRWNKTHKTAYELFLKILNNCNISVIPIECFAPPAKWPADLRVTLALKPRTFVTSFSCILNSILEEEN